MWTPRSALPTKILESVIYCSDLSDGGVPSCKARRLTLERYARIKVDDYFLLHLLATSRLRALFVLTGCKSGSRPEADSIMA